MNFTDIFSKIRRKQPSTKEAPNHWVKCQSCHALMYYKEIQACFNVCPKCNYHMRISANDRIQLLSDEGSFIEHDANLQAIDPLKFVDSKSYKKRLSEGESKTSRKSSVISGECTINGLKIQLVVFDFSFMGGSLGSVEGEKIVRAIQRSITNKNPLIIVSASGGARMQESTYSLMQMSKTSAALKLLSKEKLPYISVLTDPTMGGVSASFAWLGDLIIAEPQALVGFAGARVIKQTIGSDLPEGFQKAEFLLEHGLIDAIVERGEQKQYLYDVLNFFLVENNLQVNIFCIQKNDEFSTLNEKYSKLICKYATLKEFNIFNKKIAHAQKLGPMQAKKSYEEAIIPYKKGYCMVLDERGKNLTSKEFAKLIQDKNEISFFIGGAYGLSEEFGCSFDFKFSLSKLTLAHQFVKALLLEQIYRAFCINNHHPYHK